MPPAERSALYDRTLTSDNTRTAPTLLETHYSEIQWFWITLPIQLLRCLLMLMFMEMIPPTFGMTSAESKPRPSQSETMQNAFIQLPVHPVKLSGVGPG